MLFAQDEMPEYDELVRMVRSLFVSRNHLELEIKRLRSEIHGPKHKSETNMPQPELLTLSEVADELRVSVAYARKMADDGRLPVVDLAESGSRNRKLRVARDALNRFIECGGTG